MMMMMLILKDHNLFPHWSLPSSLKSIFCIHVEQYTLSLEISPIVLVIRYFYVGCTRYRNKDIGLILLLIPGHVDDEEERGAYHEDSPLPSHKVSLSRGG